MIISFYSNPATERTIRIVNRVNKYVLDNTDHTFKLNTSWANSLIATVEQTAAPAITPGMFAAEVTFPAGKYDVDVLIYAGEPADTDGSIAGFERSIDGDLDCELELPSDEDIALIRKILANKAVQDKLTGAVTYYDDDGVTPILVQTPTETDAEITKTPSVPA